MKKYIFSALCVVLCVLTVGCSSDSFEISDGRFVNKKTDIAYTDAPACYEPIEMSTKKYGEIDSVILYEIVGADPEKWLCESTGTVFYAEGVQLPALSEMNISKSELLLDTSNGKELSADTSGAVIDAYTEGENISRPMPLSEEIVHTVSLRFSDSSLGICYLLSYMELSEDYTVGESNYGRYFVFNRFENRCVAVSDLLGSYFD